MHGFKGVLVLLPAAAPAGRQDAGQRRRRPVNACIRRPLVLIHIVFIIFIVIVHAARRRRATAARGRLAAAAAATPTAAAPTAAAPARPRAPPAPATLRP